MSSDSSTILFGLLGARVQKVVRAADGARVVHVATEDEAAAACLVCGVLSTSVRQRRTTAPREVPYGEEPLAVRWQKVQYACREDAWPRRAFTEQIPEVHTRARVSGRLRRQVATRISEGGRRCPSRPRVCWAGRPRMRRSSPPSSRLCPSSSRSRCWGIDETRRGRPRWSHDRETGAWTKLETFETDLVDLDGTQGLLGQASGRTRVNVIGLAR